MGLRSKARLAELCALNGGVVYLQTAIDGDEGKFGRILGDIWIKYLGQLTNVNELLCEEGHARSTWEAKKSLGSKKSQSLQLHQNSNETKSKEGG